MKCNRETISRENTLERVLGGQLQLASGKRRACDSAFCPRCQIGVRVAEIGVVESVEGVQTDLELVVFVVRHVEVLIDGHIEVLYAGAVQHVAGRVSKEASGRFWPGRDIHPLAADSNGRVRREKTLS